MKKYSDYLEKIGEYGVVEKVTYPLVSLSGLENAHINEIVICENEEKGMVFSISSERIEVLLFSEELVKVGSQFTRTDEYISVPVGDSQLGSVISARGETIFGSVVTSTALKSQPLEVKIKGISSRTRIKEPFITGVSLVDILIPLGKGQKELIVGDRKSGKTSFILNIIKKQLREDTIIVYAVIGHKKSDIKKLYEFCIKEKMQDKIIIVASSSDDSPTMVYLTPFSAMSIAEYFKDKGENVLVILDDLSTHAKFYREISLIAHHFPGRESYPGDIFYNHARLLERAGNYKTENGKEVSITCLPIAETIEGDLSSYISTNLMGMTDGHIFFDTNAFNKGLRPAINSSLSVTRVGKQTQTNLQREMNRELTAFLAEYEKLQNYSQFGAELSIKVKNILIKGAFFYDFFQQNYTESIPQAVQILLFGLIWASLIQTKEQLLTIKKKLIAEYETQTFQKIYSEILASPTLYAFVTAINNKKDTLLTIPSASYVDNKTNS